MDALYVSCAAGLTSAVCGEVLAGIRDVAPHLPDQRIDVGKTCLVAQLVQELDRDAPAVDRLVEIEHEHFQKRLAVRLHRRSYADACDAGAWSSRQAVHAHGEDSGQRRRTAQRDVRRGKTETASPLVAVADVAADCIIASEQRRRARQITRGKRIAYRGARCTLA